MRILSSSIINKMMLNDVISGSKITFHYRRPTTTEIVNYFSKLYKKDSSGVSVNNDSRIEYALKVLTGFNDADFADDKGPISTDPGSLCYRQDWKELLKEQADDLLLTFAIAVFENSEWKPKQEMLPDEELLKEESVPLAKTSGDGLTIATPEEKKSV